MHRWILIALLFIAAKSHGQNEANFVKTEFQVFAVLSLQQDGILYRPAPENEMVEIRFRARARSIESFPYYGPPRLKFFREDGFDEEGMPLYRVVGEVGVVSEDLLIFFSEDARNNQDRFELSLLGIDDGPDGLPMDSVAFLNFAPVPFVGRFIDKGIKINPGANEPISVRKQLEEDVFIGLAVSNGQTHRVVLKSRWQFHPGNRHYILLLPPRREGSFRIRAYQISEYVGDDGRFVAQ